MDPGLDTRLSAIEDKLEKTYVSAEKTRKYLLFMLVVTIVAFVLPLVGLMFAIPTMLSSYSALLTL